MSHFALVLHMDFLLLPGQRFMLKCEQWPNYGLISGTWLLMDSKYLTALSKPPKAGLHTKIVAQGPS